MGFITRGFGVSIHKRDCANAKAGMAGEDAPRWLRAWWAEKVSERESFKSSLEISAMDRDGLVADVAGLIAEMRLTCYTFSARRLSDGRASVNLTIAISSKEHLTNVIQKLKKIKSVLSIQRV